MPRTARAALQSIASVRTPQELRAVHEQLAAEAAFHDIVPAWSALLDTLSRALGDISGETSQAEADAQQQLQAVPDIIAAEVLPVT